MKRAIGLRPSDARQYQGKSLRISRATRRGTHQALPAAAYRRRGGSRQFEAPFNAPEVWHEPVGRTETRYVVERPGAGYRHPVTVAEIRERILLLPPRYQLGIEVVQLSRMTRKRASFPCYGMQWGPNVYLYPIEQSLVEAYVNPPRPQQYIEARMYGGVWEERGRYWLLKWTERTVKDFYLNNVLIHEIGHLHDERNTSFEDRERYANWFATEYGYRASRGRR